MKGNYRNVLSRTARNTFFTPGPNLSLPEPMLRSSSPWTQWRHSGMPVCQTWEVEKSDPAIDFASFCMTCAPAIPSITGWNCLNCWLFVEFLWFSIIAEASAKSARRKAREGRVCRCALSPDEYGVVAQSLAGTAQGNRNCLEIADWKPRFTAKACRDGQCFVSFAKWPHEKLGMRYCMCRGSMNISHFRLMVRKTSNSF